MKDVLKKIFIVFAVVKNKVRPIAVFEKEDLRKNLGPLCLNISRARQLFKDYDAELRLFVDNKEPEVLVHARNQIQTQGFKSFKELFESGFKESMQNFQELKQQWELEKNSYALRANARLEEGLADIKFFNKKIELMVAKDPGSSIFVEAVDWIPYGA